MKRCFTRNGRVHRGWRLAQIQHHIKYYVGEVMAKNRSFYQDITEIAETRMTELIRQAEEWEARNLTFPNAGSYFRACAFTIYLAWCDVTDGLHTQNDLERLEALARGTSWVFEY